MIKVGIIGASGYAGMSVLQILLRHPEVKVEWLMSSERSSGSKISDLYPHLTGECDLTMVDLNDLDKHLGAIDVVFLSLPHGIALNHVPKILAAGKKVIDLGADYRYSDEAVFKKWYHVEHADKNLLKEAIFGLPEIYRSEIKKARLIGNPGCYPTAALLGLIPLLKNKLVDNASIIVDAKSGVSGAGRGATPKTHFCERNNGIEAYSVTTHRHMGEIEYQGRRILGDEGLKVTFVPHLVPMDRGILATIYGKSKLTTNNQQLTTIYKEYYKDEPFIRVLEGKAPNTKYVAGTNFCDLGVDYNEATGQVIVMSAIDNLMKGAASQAVQNFNLVCGFAEGTALQRLAIFP
ncbi:N-acetyl-gamma-glutamyl-phosphate reductase [candidate division WOR-1 bacterium RIFOXYA12_FULL_52_29]|uniref:N-acetyl-gamma-glutamyl-phosphate reductase n=1 Tax=candidate division WOR-1 bacterium RIFOXYC12_FULL_54_18 TaxID=1802584 RepID=A0A1F4T8U1_UNCSA|nr:MAG: N-acetyl-gamma-glutamyl-phosphate reductase [candidate division WOR-1 bacterium RIFOXYA2_FULL_51_19]OGC18522.1 MAG: N-acetyl-gamma-glutamyl-phosphate reductase [candidate division WOR-1 bacterium RIFOXYA12_FULL_52_29]OGC27381.1 MAG: N-acetyl-gamma-glutamyl-phosphate reductase [candidate division WOR-1 bacterium RIFOXYB2_FULL_45_9]OGC28939.1 MAG: N-acetyl-gamma-glutamyl-phosphate reductase [candidate division WOR-1 bacterium RIFOXYC12_FULL_54_18]OGC31300.1 MAG: N-acetyl-gamma-glutamyl-ph